MRFVPPDLEPKLLTTLREGYSARDFGRDAMAGVVVAIVALPLAIAFAIASGVRPEQGLYTAIVAGFLISALGGSRVQIGGPTGAFVVIVPASWQEFGYDGLAVATLMAGVPARHHGVRSARRRDPFIPYPVTVGFTTGIALIIAGGQLSDAFGIAMRPDARRRAAQERRGSRAPGRREPGQRRAGARDDRDHPALAARARRACRARSSRCSSPRPRCTRYRSRSTRSRATSAACRAHCRRCAFRRSTSRCCRGCFSPALTIALLAAIESLLSALVADGMVGGRHRSNAELLGQGIANMVTPLFGGIPATGAIARTATNVKNGGRTPVAGMVHALVLLVILLVAGQWASLIPMATLAGILLVVAYNMSEWHVFLRLLRGPRSDTLVLLTTFVLTVAVDLTVAIQAGVVLAALLFMRRMADVTQVKPIRDVIDYEHSELREEAAGEIPAHVEVFEINGSFCFGAARKFTETLLASHTRPRVVILRMRHVLAMDATGLHALEDVNKRLSARGARLLLSGVHAQPLVAMERGGTLERIGEANLFESFAEALAHAKRLTEAAA